jgi:DUF438 domain-containing protein
MDITPDTKLKPLIDEYPFLIEYMSTLSPAYEQLKNPVMRETMFRIATIRRVAANGGFTPEELIAKIQAEIDRHASDQVAEERKEVLKSIIRDLHAGVEMEILRKRFADLVQDVSASEIAQIEQSLIDEGLPESEVKRLCDVHVEVFKHALDDQDVPRPPAGHPVHMFMVENRAAENVMSEIEGLLCEIERPASKKTINEHSEELAAYLEKISEIEKHYLRKENQLFPRLEDHGVSGPSQVMWAIHDDVRAAIKIAKKQLEDKDPKLLTAIDEINTTIRDMIYKEEHIFYPMSLETLTDRDWLGVKKGSKEIGYAWTEPMVDWTPDIPPEQEKVIGAAVMGTVALDTGALTPDQVNLMLTHLPIDITYVDENDRVAYYSAGKERIFPRSPGIIGREVTKCHPPKSVHIVEGIVQDFKDGKSDEAEFWLQMSGRFIHIRYYPVRDGDGNYKGTIEVSQDVTEIRKLEGEKRLLDEAQ